MNKEYEEMTKEELILVCKRNSYLLSRYRNDKRELLADLKNIKRVLLRMSESIDLSKKIGSKRYFQGGKRRKEEN